MTLLEILDLITCGAGERELSGASTGLVDVPAVGVGDSHRRPVEKPMGSR